MRFNHTSRSVSESLGLKPQRAEFLTEAIKEAYSRPGTALSEDIEATIKAIGGRVNQADLLFIGLQLGAQTGARVAMTNGMGKLLESIKEARQSEERTYPRYRA